jgi:hypothetical protein
VTRPRQPLRGKAKIALRAGGVLGRRKIAKHFDLTITDSSFSSARNTAAIVREAALDGFYVLRTNVPTSTLDTAATVLAYKALAGVERAFRSIKTVDLEIRPIHHHLADRVRTHVFLCMLAYYLVWHMRRAWAEILLTMSTVPPPQPPDPHRSPPPRSRRQHGPRPPASALPRAIPCTASAACLHDLASLTRNLVRLGDAPAVVMLARPTALQQHTFDKLAIGIAP